MTDSVESYTQEGMAKLWEELGTGLTQALVGYLTKSHRDLMAGLERMRERFKELNNAFVLGAPAPDCELIPEPSDDPAERRADLDRMFAELDAEGASPEMVRRMKQSLKIMDPELGYEVPSAKSGMEALLEALGIDADSVVIIKESAAETGTEPTDRPGLYL